VGTRPPIRRPDALLLDGARVLTDGAELIDVLPLDDARDVVEVQALAAAVAAAVGSPWGGAFRAAGGGLRGRLTTACDVCAAVCHQRRLLQQDCHVSRLPLSPTARDQAVEFHMLPA
jgi:hypothetical protein